MKLIIAALVALSLVACASVGQAAKTPAQVAAEVCPSVQAVLAVLSVPGAVDPAVDADLLVAAPAVSAVCNGGQLVQLSDLKSLSSIVPLLIKVVNLSPLPQADKQAAILGVAIVQAALAPLVQ